MNINNIKKFQKLLTPSNIKQVVKGIKFFISFCKSCKSKDKPNNEVNIELAPIKSDEPIIIQFIDELKIPYQIKIYNKTNKIEIHKSSQPYRNNKKYDIEIYNGIYNKLYIDINNYWYRDNEAFKYEIKLSKNMYIYFS